MQQLMVEPLGILFVRKVANTVEQPPAIRSLDELA
jgi:hypothetical protein